MTDQPRTKPSTGDVWAALIADVGARHPGLVVLFEARRATGLARYGTPLQPHNGRDVTRDAREEALDLLAYARQGAMETTGLDQRRWYKIEALALEAVIRICAVGSEETTRECCERLGIGHGVIR